ncbi:MAG: gamma-glutamyl-gamma-aminobutyrate hydrolase family protein [Solirubrobacterales bacterium]
MSTPVPRIAISAIPRPIATGYGADRADTVAAGTVAAVVAAGGVPIVLPVVPSDLAASQLEAVDGLVLSGGHDLAIPLADGADEADRWIDPARDDHELALWEAASAARLPVLGICRGAQLVNHARGGLLAQQVDDHDAGESHAERMHLVEVGLGTRLAAACGAGPVAVNTIHHQVVAEPGHGLHVCARSADGLIEGIETGGGSAWFVGVQWHPELMPGSPAGAGLFRALVAAAA